MLVIELSIEYFFLHKCEILDIHKLKDGNLQLHLVVWSDLVMIMTLLVMLLISPHLEVFILYHCENN